MRAGAFDPPFGVSRQLVDYYRATREKSIAAMVAATEYDALTTGLAVRANRVQKLQQLASLMEQDLFGGFLWTDQVKMIGSGPFSKEVDFEEFNGAEVTQYRGVLEDIAKEMGDRRQTNTTVSVTVDQLTQMSTEELEALAKKRGLV